MMVVQKQGGIDMKPTATDIEDFVRDLFHWLYIDYAHCVGYASPDDENDFSPNPIEKHGKLQKKTLARAAKSLGLPIETLMQLDGREISSWMKMCIRDSCCLYLLLFLYQQLVFL